MKLYIFVVEPINVYSSFVVFSKVIEEYLQVCLVKHSKEQLNWNFFQLRISFLNTVTCFFNGELFKTTSFKK